MHVRSVDEVLRVDVPVILDDCCVFEPEREGVSQEA